MSFPVSVLRAPWALAAVPSALAFVTPALQAQTSEPSRLDTVVVTATRYAQPLAEALPHTTVLTRAEIERAQSLDLPSLLAREAGVQFAANGGRGSVTTLFVRGAPSLQVLVLIDGVPLSKQDASGAVSLEHLVLDQVERIEIVRGNVSAIYGSGAIGGVIQVFTRQAGDTTRAGVAVEAGAFGFGRVSAGGSTRFGATHLSVGIAHQQQRGFSAQDAAANPAVNPDRDGYRNHSLNVSLGHELAPGHSLGLSLTHADGRLDYDSAFATPSDVQTARTKLQTARVYSDNRLGAAWQSSLSLAVQRDDARSHETGTFGYDSRFVTRAQALNWTNRVELDPNWSLTAGLEHQRQNIDAEDGFGGLYAHRRNVDALFAGMQGRLGAHSLQANLRHDRIEDTGSKSTGYFGWGMDLGRGFALRASASSAFNAPPLGYLHAPYFGNPALQPEQARSAELGLQYQAGANLLRATWFESRVHDEFQFDFVTSRFENVARTRNRGLELSASGRKGATDWRAALTAQDPVDASTGEQRLRRARSLASASFAHKLAGWTLGADWRYAGKRRDIGGSTLDAYSVLGLTAQRDLGGGLQFFARVENLGDERYQTVQGYNQAPRGVFAGLRWTSGR